MQRYLLFCVFMLSLQNLFAQGDVRVAADTLVHLREVEVEAQSFRRSDHGARIFQLDTSAIAMLSCNSLAGRLDREAPLFIKSYGPGSLSTLSLRGTGAAHTAVLWNGLPLNSPMLGLYDFSLLPGFLLGDVSIQSGGNGPLAGSGAVGGAIFMNPVWDTVQGHRITMLGGIGSFGEMQYGTGYRFTNGVVTTQTRIYHQKASNNFRYNNFNGEMLRQPHAGFSQIGFSHDTRFGNARHHLDLHAWYLENHREIPPLMVSRYSGQVQDDASLRLSARWGRSVGNLNYHLRGGLVREQIRYADPVAGIDNKSTANTYQFDAGIAYRFSRHLHVEGEVAWTESCAEVEQYAKEAAQSQQTLTLKAVWDQQRIRSYLALRESFFQGGALPVLPSAGLNLTLHRDWILRADVAAVYRIPTMNDRFWNPGGNPDLRPEQGFNTSMALQWSRSAGAFRWSMDPGIFYSELQNAIVWLPGKEGYFRANNLHRIHSRGIEAQARLEWSRRTTLISLRFIPVYTLAEIAETGADMASALNKQLVYTPRLIYKTQLLLQKGPWSLRYYHNYTGYRYTTPDHSHSLDPFQLCEVVAGWEGSLFGYATTATLTVRNLYNEQYQVIAWRAMPGRSVSAGLKINLYRPLKK